MICTSSYPQNSSKATAVWHTFPILLMLLLCTSCGGDKFDQKGFNIMAEEIKAEINKLSIPCPVGDKQVHVANLKAITLEGFTASEATLEKFKKYTLKYDLQEIDIVLNKTTADGFQFKYSTDITEYSLDSKPIVTRDEGTIWLYCDKHKKYNEPKEAPEVTPSIMVTVE